MVTVFTPIFNRANIITQLYESLLRQTSFDFEWLIIDDGSTDGVEALINEWIRKKNMPFEIRFFRQQNGGKHRAINRGVKLARGDAFFIVDSDDYITDSAIEWINAHWKEIADDDEFAGLSGLKAKFDGELIGDGEISFQSYIDATNLERSNYHLEGDKAEVYKTGILKKYPFPEFSGEKFVTEATVWNKIAYDGYKIRWYNKVIYLCEYRGDGLTQNIVSVTQKSPRGHAVYLAGQCIYENWSRNKYIEICLHHYETCFDKVPASELREILGLSEREAELAFGGIICKCKSLKYFLAENGITSTALYGYGCWGKQAYKYLNYVGISVEYVIDRRGREISDAPAFLLSDSLPVANNIIIALKDDTEYVYQILKKKGLFHNIFVWADIVEYMNKGV